MFHVSKHCPKCNVTYDEDVTFCFECGTILQELSKPKLIPTEEGVAERSPSETPPPQLHAEGMEQKPVEVDVPTYEAFTKIWGILSELEKTQEMMGIKLEDFRKITDAISRRIIMVEEDIKKILEEIRSLRG